MSSVAEFRWSEMALLDDLVKSGEVKLGRGNVISKIDIRNNPGTYPIYSSSSKNNGKMGEYGEFMFDEEMISWSVDGGGYFFYRPKHKFSVTNVSGYMRLSQNLDYKFTAYLLQFQHEYFSFDYQTKAHPSVIREFYLFPKVSLPEQQKIATILSSVDNLIETTRAQIDKLKDLKTGMMQELLTTGTGHTEFKDSPVGRIPASWNIEDLIDLSTNGISNGVFNDPKKVGKGKKIINVYDMYQGFGVDSSLLKLVDVDEKEFKRNKVEYGDIFFTRSSLKLEGIAYCNINLSKGDDITYDGHLMRIRPDQSRVSPKYLTNFCLSDHSRKFFMSAAKHSTMTTIGQSDIAPLKVVLPPLSEQEKIVDVIDSIESKIQSSTIRLVQLTTLKKALMQDLLTGKVRVNVDNNKKEERVAV